jgi:hypothetical protein
MNIYIYIYIYIYIERERERETIYRIKIAIFYNLVYIQFLISTYRTRFYVFLYATSF